MSARPLRVALLGAGSAFLALPRGADDIFSAASSVLILVVTTESLTQTLAGLAGLSWAWTASGAISDFVHRHPTLKMLALSFLLLIGVTLVAEGTPGLTRHVAVDLIRAEAWRSTCLLQAARIVKQGVVPTKRRTRVSTLMARLVGRHQLRGRSTVRGRGRACPHVGSTSRRVDRRVHSPGPNRFASAADDHARTWRPVCAGALPGFGSCACAEPAQFSPARPAPAVPAQARTRPRRSKG